MMPAVVDLTSETTSSDVETAEPLNTDADPDDKANLGVDLV
jgi:hypothetical protein